MSLSYLQNNVQMVTELGWARCAPSKDHKPSCEVHVAFPNLQARNMPNGTRLQRDLLLKEQKARIHPPDLSPDKRIIRYLRFQDFLRTRVPSPIRQASMAM